MIIFCLKILNKELVFLLCSKIAKKYAKNILKNTKSPSKNLKKAKCPHYNLISPQRKFEHPGSVLARNMWPDHIPST